MDPENNLSRVERTLWTVWCYISEAVSRFIRPQPTNIVNDDPNSDQESAAGIDQPHSDSTDEASCSGGVDEEQPIATSSLLSSSRPVVTWERCNTEIDLGSDEEIMQHKTKLREGNESKEDGEGMREEQHSQTENDHLNDLRAKEDKQETMDMEKLHTSTSENDECERVDTGPQNLAEVAISEERTEGETSAEKETVRSVTSDDHPAETQVKKGNDQMHDKEEPDLEAEHSEVAEENDKTHSEEEKEAKDTEVKLCIIANLSPEEEDHIHEVKPELQNNDAVRLDDHPGEDEIIKQTQLKEEDDQMQHEEEQDLEETTEIKVSICISTDISPVECLHMQEIEAEAQKNNGVTLDEYPRMDETIKETKEKEDDDKAHSEDEQDLGVEDTEVKVCIIASLSPEEEDHMHQGEAEALKKDAVTLDEYPREDEHIKETQLKEEEDTMHHEEAQDVEAEHTEVPEEDNKTHSEEEQEAENTEVKMCIITSLSREDDDHIQETESEVQQKDAVTLDEQPREDKIIKETEEEEEEADQMHHEQDLEAETTEAAEEDDKAHNEDEQDLGVEDTEVKVCIITSLIPEDDHMQETESEVQQNNAVTRDDHPREGKIIKEANEKEEEAQMHHKEEQDLEAETTEAAEEDDKTHNEDEQDLEVEDTEVKVCIITSLSPEEEDHTHQGVAEALKKDAVTLDDHPAKEEIITETQLKEEDDQIPRDEEQDLEAEDTEVQLCIITNLSPEDDHMQETESEVQQNDAVTRDDHPREGKIIKETEEKEEEDQMHHEQDLEAETTEAAEEDDKAHSEDEQGLGVEDTEVKMCIITSLSPEDDDHMHQGEAEAPKKDAVTLDEYPREDEHIKETQLKEEEDTMHHEEEQDVEAEHTEVPEEDNKTHSEEEQQAENTEVKMCIITSLSPEDDDHVWGTESEVQQKDAVTLDEQPREDKIIKETEEKEEDDQMHQEEQQDLAETRDVMLQLASENIKKSDELTNQAVFGELPPASVDNLVLVGQYPVLAHRSENDEGQREKEGETEQHAAIEKVNIDEAAANKTIEVSEVDKNIKRVAEGSDGEIVLTEYDACSKEAAQESITQLHTAKFTDKEKEDMRVQAVQAKIGQTGETIADISVDKRLVDQDKEKELSISREAYTEECSKEIVHLSASVTVKPEGETAQETSEEFKNIPLEISEGQFAMPQELNTPTCEEIQEGVSKYNNELWGVDENTTQRFLEAGDCEEIPATQLPEEVESGERESLQNSGCNTGADYLLLKVSMEEKQESKEESETTLDLVGQEHSEILDPAREAEKTLVEGVVQELGHVLGKEEGNLLEGSMKTEVTEGHAGLADETERRSEELHDGTKRSSFSKEADATGGDCETKEAVTATEVVRFVIQESVQTINLAQSFSGSSSLQEDTSESVFVRHSVETEPKSDDDNIVEMQDKAIKREEGGHGDEEEDAEDGIQSTKERENLHLRVTETAGEVLAEESPLNAESELSPDSEPQEIKNQSPDRACEISAAQIIETETAVESRPRDLPVTPSEVKSSSTNGHQDVIDEEILDLWIETAMSEDTDDINQEEPEPDALNEERGDLSLQKELLAESISGESEVVSDTEMSSSTVESGFLGQSLGDLGTQSSEAQLLKSTSAGSLQWIHDMVASMSADIPGVAARPQPQSETQDVLTGESAEPEEESTTDTGVQSPEGRQLDQESEEKAGEERVERVETESGSQKEYGDFGEAVKQVEAEEEHLESCDELKPTESEQPESDSQGGTRTESEKNTLNLSSPDGPQPRRSEDIAESSLPGLNKAEVVKEPTVKSEVDAPVLDFAMQRSRIAVKNPRIRPPKNARSLLHMPSVEPTPTPTPSSRLPVKLPGGVPLGGMGIGIKLPGLGAGLPVLKKRPPAAREENTQETGSQEPETKPEEESKAPQQDETPKKPKWMPPKHPGFGNPLMAELKTKLKKTPKE